jgi:hypothetical protein
VVQLRSTIALLAVIASLGACKRDGEAPGIAPDRQADATAPSPSLSPSPSPSPTPSTTELVQDEPGCLGAPPLAREGSSAAGDKARVVGAALTKAGLTPIALTSSVRFLMRGQAGGPLEPPKARPAFVGYADTAGIVHVDGEERTVACWDAPVDAREIFARDAKGDFVRVRLDPAAVKHWRPAACGCDPEAVQCAGKTPVKVQDAWTLPAGATFAGTVTIRAEVTEFEPVYRTKGCPPVAPAP